MKVIVDSRQNIAEAAAQGYVSFIQNKPNAVLGLATGSTPEDLYAELIRLCNQGEVTFKDVTTFNLDEYCGLTPDHPQSYRYFMQDKLFDHIDINPRNTFVPDGFRTSEEDLVAYDRAIAEHGGIDLQLLGIGGNGHIAFNEPGTSFQSITHMVELTPETRQANSRFFNNIDEVPTHAICMGMRTIMNTQNIILMAIGKNKAEAIRNTVYGDIDPMCPASLLQLHPNVTIFVDHEAGSLL